MGVLLISLNYTFNNLSSAPQEQGLSLFRESVSRKLVYGFHWCTTYGRSHL